jgi:hypothetical protein
VTVRAALAVVVVAIAVVLAVPALAAGPTGDPATIRLFRDAASRTNALPAMQLVQSGYVAESDKVGSPDAFAYRFGYGSVPRGWVRSTETITYTQHLGRVVWLTDVLTASAPGCTTSSGCPLAPIELFVTRRGAFAGVVDRPGGAVGCFEREPLAAVPYRAGGRWWSAVGDFRPMVVRGNQILITDTYAFSDGQHVVERDSIDGSTHLFAGASVRVGPGRTRGVPGFSFAQRDAPLTYTPPPPRVTVCR